MTERTSTNERLTLIEQINSARAAALCPVAPLDDDQERTLGGPSRRLAVYGSLAPGRSNHHHLADLRGTWTEGWIEGVLHDRGWGAGMGFPGIVLESGGPRVMVWLLETDDLPRHWARLDAFEGDEYIRLLTLVHKASATPCAANVYALRRAAFAGP
jgi:gamma-glutamylcyclotransferase (GGCT)/AIG2-like uncharacterized protein YtfP